MRNHSARLSRVLILAMLLTAASPMLARPALAQETATEPAAAATAPAAPEEAKGGLLDADPGTAFFTVIIFVALLIILRVTAWKPILGGLKDRERAIRDSIEAAKKAKDEAERTTRELEARMAECSGRAAQQLQQAKADALKVAESIRAGRNREQRAQGSDPAGN